MRALLIVNPWATSTTPLRRDVITHALASQLDLEVAETRYRGHAVALAGRAASDGYQLVLTLGGDGTVNEAVNGLLSTPVNEVGPALAALPGGSANVFTRALGLPPDAIDATGQIIAALEAGRQRSIGLGLAAGRYFTFNAGLGLDAEVVRGIEGLRARGRTATPWLYTWTAVRHFYVGTDRKQPAITVERDGAPPESDLFLGIVSNTAPWTYLGSRPVNPSPAAGFGTGLDLFALRRLSTVGTLRAVRQMIASNGQPPNGRDVLRLHDQPGFTLRSSRPMALQLDGEYVGEHEAVVFQSVPHALRVIA